MDPYKVLNVPKNFTLEQLREQYKRIALQVHPDKGGSSELFNMVTKCYKQLLKHQERKIEKDFMELKKEFKQFDLENKNQGVNAELADLLARPQTEPPPPPPPRSRGSRGGSGTPAAMPSPTPTRHVTADPTDVFNRVFEENRLEDAHNAGYGSVMAQSSAMREDITIPNNMRGFKLNKFNQTFEKQAAPSDSHAMQVYKQPEPTLLAKRLAFSELGVAKIDDFSGANDSQKRLNYTDYLRAHSTTRLIDPRAVKGRQEFKSVEELEMHRGNVSMTEEEQDEYRAYQDKLREAEERRLSTLRQQDRAYEDHHASVNMRMLERMRR